MSTKRNFLASVLAAASLTALGLPAAVHAQSANETAMERIQRTKTIRIGAIAGAIPYFNKNLNTGKWEGFGPDFAEMFAARLGVKTEYLETTWGNSVLDVQTNKIDLMFGMAPTPARKEVVNFSDTLFNNTYTTVCRKGFVGKSWAELDTPETRVVVDVGSSHDQLATRVLKNANVTRLENSGAATLALSSGRADCQILVVLLAKPLLEKRPGIGTMSIPTPVETAPVSIGLRKEGDDSLQKAVNTWLAEIRAKDEVRGVILGNMQKLANVPPEAFPPEIKF